MNRWTALALVLVSLGTQAQVSALPAAITLSVGDSRVLLVDIRRVALGSGKVVSITTPER